MKKIVLAVILLIISVLIIKSCLGGNELNTLADSHFTSEGKLVRNGSDTAKVDSDVALRFYVESSGSMNGFFRNGVPTDFKRDVYEVMSYYSDVTKDINVMSNAGGVAGEMSLAHFQTAMNTGALQSNSSTQITVMLDTIIRGLKDKKDVAVLISDMKYDPVGYAAPQVLLTQYATEISKIVGKSGKSFSLIGAVSQFVDRTGNVLAPRSPYYYLVIGNQNKVAYVRNGISAMLQQKRAFVDNLDFGYKYAVVPYSFGIPNGVLQYEKQPTFYGYSDSCTITLKLNLEAYRWPIADKNMLSKSLVFKPIYGSKVSIKDVEVNVSANLGKESGRYAAIKLNISDMPLDMDVVEWSLKIPGKDITSLREFMGAGSPNDVSKTYSLEQLIDGLANGVANVQPSPNYILISKKNL